MLWFTLSKAISFIYYPINITIKNSEWIMVFRRCFPLKSVLKYLSVKSSYHKDHSIDLQYKNQLIGFSMIQLLLKGIFEQISVSSHPISMIIWSLYLLCSLMLQVFIKLIDFLQLIFIKKKCISLPKWRWVKSK